MSILNKLRARFVRWLGPEKQGLPYPGVELFHWKPSNGQLNFGDQLSEVIVTKLLADHGLFLGEGTRRAARLFAVGSILHFARDGDVVWGSGINGKIPASQPGFPNLDVRAVRGPMTRAVLLQAGLSVPEVYGDPALLLPVLLPGRFARRSTRAHVFVPNLHDLSLTGDKDNVVSPLSPWNQCVSEILSAELVLASSLHGLVIAEAYGIPARYVRLSETESLFKYQDYVQGTGRPDLEFAKSIAEGLEMGGMAPPQFDPNPLLSAFPLDLWDRSALD